MNHPTKCLFGTYLSGAPRFFGLELIATSCSSPAPPPFIVPSPQSTTSYKHADRCSLSREPGRQNRASRAPSSRQGRSARQASLPHLSWLLNTKLTHSLRLRISFAGICGSDLHEVSACVRRLLRTRRLTRLCVLFIFSISEAR